jgi:hypothetical protein
MPVAIVSSGNLLRRRFSSNEQETNFAPGTVVAFACLHLDYIDFTISIFPLKCNPLS